MGIDGFIAAIVSSVELDPNAVSTARPTLLILAASMIDAASSSERALRRINSGAPRAGSPLSRLFNEATLQDARKHVVDATLVAEYALLSACDHARAFATLLRVSRRPATSVVTLTRAALESLARARWLARDEDLNALVHRTLSLLYGDLRYPAYFGEQMLTRNGLPLDPAAQRALYRSELARLGLQEPAKVEISKLVADLIDADIKHQDGPRLYSILSSVAHAHRAGINAFVQIEPGTDHFAMEAPLPTITEFVLQVAVTLLSTTEAVLSWYGAVPAELDRVHGAMARVAARLDLLPEEAFAES